MYIGQVAKLTGLSTRALRHFETQGIVHSTRLENGYRDYSDSELRRLFVALVYRELGMPLKEIARALEASDLSELLDKQYVLLLKKKQQIDEQIAALEAVRHGGMFDMGKACNAFVRQALDTNDALYGDEVKNRWGEDHYEASRQKLEKLSDEEFQVLLLEGKQIMSDVAKEMKRGAAPESEQVQVLIARHFAHLKNFGDFYTLEVYEGLGQMYSADPRFAKTFNEVAPGLAKYFTQAIEYFCIEQA